MAHGDAVTHFLQLDFTHTRYGRLHASRISASLHFRPPFFAALGALGIC